MHMKNMGKNLQASLQRKLVQIMDSKLVEFGKQLQDIEVKRNNIFTANIDSWTDKA